MGNISAVYEDDTLVARYAYDSLNRIIREDNRHFAKTVLFAYDENGNITGRREYAFSMKSTEELTELEPVSVVKYTYDGDRLMSYNGESFTYDAIGNPTKYRGKSVSWTYGRHLSSFGGVYVGYDGSDLVSGIDGKNIAYDRSGNIICDIAYHYLYDESGSLLGFVDRETEETYLYRKDVQGNIIAILDNTGAVVVQYKYDAWGNHKVLNPDGTENTATDFLGNLNPFRYRGYYYSTALGLYYLKSRFYDPEVGRFINADSVEYLDPSSVNGLNLYAYCANNPVMNVDPSGHNLLSVFVQFIVSLFSYTGTAIASIWNQAIRNDMNSIGWNPFNTDDVLVLNSNKVSFYKGVPVFRTNLHKSGSFYGIFLRNSATLPEVKHERGHNTQLMIMGPFKYGLMIGLPSTLGWSKRDYYERPWEITADIFGNVTTISHSQEDIDRGFWYLIVSSLFGPFGYFFLLGEY